MRKRSLLEELEIDMSEVLRYDFFIAIIGSSLTAWLAWDDDRALTDVVGTASQLLGAVLGTVIAAFAIITAFMDQAFLRKLRFLGHKPIFFVAPLAFTILLGLLAAFGLLVLSALQPFAPDVVRIVAAAVSGLFTTWTLASLFPDVKMLVQFVRVRFAASEMTDDDPRLGP